MAPGARTVGELAWEGLGHLRTSEVGEVLERLVRRMERHLRRNGQTPDLRGRGRAEWRGRPRREPRGFGGWRGPKAGVGRPRRCGLTVQPRLVSLTPPVTRRCGRAGWCGFGLTPPAWSRKSFGSCPIPSGVPSPPGGTDRGGHSKTRHKQDTKWLASQWDPAKLLLELVELMGIEPMTS